MNKELKTAGDFYAFAIANYEGGNFQTAIEAFKRSLALEDNWQSYQGLGSALLLIQQHQQAIAAFKKSLALKEDWQSLKGLGWGLHQMEQHHAAIEALNRSITLKNDWQSYQFLGEIFFKTNQFEQAINAYEKSLLLEKDIPSYKGLITSLIFSERYDDGMKILTDFLEYSNKDKAKKILHMSFLNLLIYHSTCKQNKAKVHNNVTLLQKYFTESILSFSIEEIYETGTSYSLTNVTITNMIILHGGYFKLLESGKEIRKNLRYVDSLYQPPFPSLQYNVMNNDILAPWITLSAQQILLDLDLEEYSVIEYGSGMSTFFFCKNAYKCFSYEDDLAPSVLGNWSKEMQRVSILSGIEVNLIKPNKANIEPKWILNNLLENSQQKILISIDGGDREKHFRDWVQFLSENNNLQVILMLDNSDRNGFSESFETLKKTNATICHHYGPVYGQINNIMCTTFCTYTPSLLLGKTSSPHFHNQQWGSSPFMSRNQSKS